MTRSDARKKLVTPSGEPVFHLEDLPQDERQEAFAALVRAEESTIAQELAGMAGLASKFVYEIKFKTGKTDKRGNPIFKYVYGLSINGVRELGKKFYKKGFKRAPMIDGAPYFVDVDIEVPNWKGDPERTTFARAGVKLTSIDTTEESIATAMHEMMAKRWYQQDGTWKTRKEFDANYCQIALSKAQRKALEDMIEPALKFKWLTTWYAEKKKVQEIDERGRVEPRQIEEKSEAASSGKAVLRKRIFAICGDQGLDSTKENEVIVKFCEGAFQKPMSDFTDEELQKAGDQLETFAAKKGKDEFCKLVRGEA